MSEFNDTSIYLLDSLTIIDSKVRALINIQTKELESAHSQKTEQDQSIQILAVQTLHCNSFNHLWISVTI